MINLPNTIKLANTKFQARKWSAFFSGCTVAIGAVLILVAFIIVSGITGIAEKYLKDPFYGRYIYTLSRTNNADQTDTDKLEQLQSQETPTDPKAAAALAAEIAALEAKIALAESTNLKLNTADLSEQFKQYNPKSIKESYFYTSKYDANSQNPFTNRSSITDLTNTPTTVSETDVVLGFGLSGLYPDTSKTRELSTSLSSIVGFGSSSTNDPLAKEKFSTPLDITALPDLDLVSDIVNTKVDDSKEYLPVIIPIERVYEMEYNSNYLDALASNTVPQEELNSKMLDASSKYLGKIYDLTTLKKVYDLDSTGKQTSKFKYVETKTGVKAKIIGFRKSQSLAGINITSESSISRNDMITTVSNLDNFPALKQSLNADLKAVPMYIFEFNSKDDGYGFYKETTGNDLSAGAFDISGRFSSIDAFQEKAKTLAYRDSVDQNISIFDGFKEILNLVTYSAFYAGGFLLFISAIFIFMTVSKLISDSKKEIGVFRSFGATRLDIQFIYYCYTIILTLFGFALGLVLSYFISFVASLLGSSAVFAQVLPLTRTLKAIENTSLVGFPYLQILAILGIVVLVGLVASFFPVWRGSRIDPIKALRDE